MDSRNSFASFDKFTINKKIDGKFKAFLYVKWGGDSWVHTIRNLCLYQSEF